MPASNRSKSRRRPPAAPNASRTATPASTRAGLFTGFGGFGARRTGATVVRLNLDARKRGVGTFEATGLRIASSKDFVQMDLPADLDGADVIVFERFGIAIVDADPDRLTAAMIRG